MRIEIAAIERGSRSLALNAENTGGGFKRETSKYCTTRQHRNYLLDEASELRTYLNLTEVSLEPKPGPIYRLLLQRLIQISSFLRNSRIVSADLA